MRSNIGTVEDAEDHLYTKWYKVAVTVAVMTVVHLLLACTLLYSAFKVREPVGLLYHNSAALRSHTVYLQEPYLISLGWYPTK